MTTYGGFDLIVADAASHRVYLGTIIGTLDDPLSETPRATPQTFSIDVVLAEHDLSTLTDPPFAFFLSPQSWEEFTGSGIRLFDWRIDAVGGSGWTTGYIGITGAPLVQIIYTGST